MGDRPIYLLEDGAEPVKIDPATISHSVLVAQRDKTDTSSMDATEMVDELQVLLNPDFWAAFAKIGDPDLIQGRRHLALVDGGDSPKALMTVLDKLGLPEDASVYVRLAIVSLDSGANSQEVATALVFKEDEPRIVIADKEPVLERANT